MPEKETLGIEKLSSCTKVEEGKNNSVTVSFKHGGMIYDSYKEYRLVFEEEENAEKFVLEFRGNLDFIKDVVIK